MNLSEMHDREKERLLTLAQKEADKALEGEVVDDDDDEEDDEEAELREELDLALSHLSDACKMLETVISLGQNGRIRYMMFKELIDRASEINAYLDQYDFTDADKKDDDFPVLDMDTLEWKI